jgi:ferredoxin-nitrite reductase
LSEKVDFCPKDGATFERALKINPRERLKARKVCPLDIIDDIEQIAKRGYLEVPEEDFVLLKWWGVIHEKPKTGRFSLRIGVPGGKLTGEQLICAGELAKKFGQGILKITARQGLQLFRIPLNRVRKVMDEIQKSGLKLAGGCGDAPRNITTCGLAGLCVDEILDPWPTIEAYVKRFVGNRAYSNLPHKFKVCVSSCRWHCCLPEINDVALLAVTKDGEKGFTPLIGGSTALPPRLAKHLPVFVRQGEEAMDFVEAFLNTWQENPKYRLSFGRARSKFLVEDCSLENIRKSIEARIGRTLEDYTLAPSMPRFHDHLGPGKQKDGRYYLGLPVQSGMLKAEQAIELGNLACTIGAGLRTTVHGNLIFTNLDGESEIQKVKDVSSSMGIRPDISSVRKQSNGCVGHPFCTYSLGLGISAREMLERVISHVEKVFGDVNVSIISADCPHACSRVWLADIGLEGTSKTLPGGKRVQAFHILVGGGRGAGGTSLARLYVRRALPEEVELHVERLIREYLNNRVEGETFKDFCNRVKISELYHYDEGGTDGSRQDRAGRL